MFKDIISRDNGTPWPATNMTSATWLNVPLRRVHISDLVATQDGVYFHALRPTGVTPVGGDQYPHVIVWRGQRYLEDGHHRVTRALLAHRSTVLARVLDLDAC